MHAQPHESGEFEERRASIQQEVDAVTGKQLSALGKLLRRFCRVCPDACLKGAYLRDQLQVTLTVCAGCIGVQANPGFDDRHVSACVLAENWQQTGNINYAGLSTHAMRIR